MHTCRCLRRGQLFPCQEKATSRDFPVRLVFCAKALHLCFALADPESRPPAREIPESNTSFGSSGVVRTSSFGKAHQGGKKSHPLALARLGARQAAPRIAPVSMRLA